jgi:RHS repeat-associated protein
VGAAGDAPDSLVRFDTMSVKWYRRDLKHGAAVYFDQNGRHQATRNRVGAITTFTWGSVAGQTRLLSITVPPNGGGFTYHLYWNATTAKLDSIQDPYARALKATMTSGSDTTLTRLVQKTAFPQDDWDTTSFEYTGGRMTRRLAESSAMTGGFAGTVYQYQNNARVTKVKIPSGLTGSDTAFITITPWDEKGLALAYSGQVGVLTLADTGLATRVDGPIAGTGDAADFWVNRFGEPVKSVQLGLGAVTLLWHDSTASLPAAVTKVKYANGRVIRLSYNARGNLAQQVDSTSHLGVLGFPNNVTTWTYGDAGTPDSPTQVTDALGRHADYTYNSLGLTDSVVDSRATRTKFFSRLGATDPLRGEVDSVTDRQVETWLEASGPDTAQEAIRDQTNSFTYDAMGNVVTWTSPVGVTAAYARNLAGFVTDAYDPMGYHRLWGMDGFNRVTGYTQHVAKENAPGVNQLLNCDVKQVVCNATAAPYNVASQFTTNLSSTFHYNDDGIDIADDPRLVERRFAYDAAGHQAKEWDGYDTQGSGTTRRISYFNVAGLLDSTVSRTGLKVKYLYDAIGRRSAVVLPTVKTPYQGAGYSTSDTVYGDSVSYVYDIMSNVLVSKNRWGAITRSYYANGLLRSQVSTQQLKDSMYFRYDVTGTRTRLVHVLGTTTDSIGYFYGVTSGALDSMLVWWGSPLNASRKLVFVWDRLGRRRQVVYPISSGLVVTYRYDGAGVLRRIQSTNPTLLQGANRFAFQWRNDAVDPSGRILHQLVNCVWVVGSNVEGMPCGASSQLEVTNAFDRFGVLVYQKTSGQTIETDSTGVDRSGNIMHQRKNTDATDFALDGGTGVAPSNLLKSRSLNGILGYTYAYSGELARQHEQDQPAGNETGTYWYDALGRTSGVGKAGAATRMGPNSCLYDADGQMFQGCNNVAPSLAFDGHHVAGGGSTGNSWVFAYGPSVDDPLIGLNRGLNSTTTEIYWITDGQGRQFAVGQPDGSFNSGAITVYQSGGQYAGGTQNAYSFNADRFGSANTPGVSVFRNRVYDQQTGRWTQEDPVGIAGGLNLYQYAGNNPAIFLDPFGLKVTVADEDIRQAIVKLLHSSPTFRRIFNALEHAPTSKVNLVIRAATPEDLGRMVDAGVKGGSTLRPNPLQPGAVIAIDRRPGAEGEFGPIEGVIAHEVVHAAGAFSREAKTGVSWLCQFNNDVGHGCAQPIIAQISEESKRAEGGNKEP